MEELQSLIKRMKDMFDGDPWYGKSVMSIFDEVNTSLVYIKPNNHSHSLIDLLYHMLNWENFTLQQLEGMNKANADEFQVYDWREINPAIHTWENGVVELKKMHKRIIEILESSTPELLNRKAKFRDYNLGYLINGLIEHQIYHLGQVAYLHKYLAP